MGVRLGFFGADVFGQGFFGWSSTGLPLSGSIISESLLAALSQEIPNAQIIAARVLVNGVDVSSLVESIAIRAADTTSTGAVDVIFIGDASADVVNGDEIKVYFSFSLAGGQVFTQKVFTGAVKSVVPALGSERESTQVIAWDASEALLATAPHNTTWTGTARDLVLDELTELGIDNVSLDFADFSMTAFDLSNFTTVRDLIVSVANAKDAAGIFTQGSGRLCVWSYLASRTTTYTIPRTGYTFLQPINSTTYRLKNFTVTGTTGTTATATGTGTSDDGESSLFLSALADVQARADAVVGKLERTSVNLQVPLNPIIRVGDQVSIERSPSVFVNYRVNSLTHTIQWSGQRSPGAWTNLNAEAVA